MQLTPFPPLLPLVATTPSTTPAPRPAPVPTPRAIADATSGARILQDVKLLGGPRPTGSEQLKAAAERVRDAVAALGWSARIETADVGGQPLYNVVADRRGTAPDATRRLVIGAAHLDTVSGAYGANDNASGSATLVETARVLSSVPTRHDVRLVWFDGEEWGLLGSRRYVAAHKDELKARTKAVLVGEVMGSPAGTPRIVVADAASRPLAEAARSTGTSAGVDAPVVVDRGAGSDHVSFAQIGLPAAVVASMLPQTASREDPNYHRPSDTPDKLNPAVLERSADLFVAALHEQAQTS